LKKRSDGNSIFFDDEPCSSAKKQELNYNYEMQLHTRK